MHILFLSDNFPPETNAPASRLHEHARRWVAAGHRVTVITCAPNFPQGRVHEGYRNAWYARTTLDGIDVVQDVAKGATLVEAAARGGLPEAKYVLARLLIDGVNGPKSPELALPWMRAAADAGVPGAQFDLGRMYREGVGVKRDDGEALEWFRLAAKRGISARSTSWAWRTREATR